MKTFVGLFMLTLALPAFAQQNTMRMPDDVYATLSAVVQKFPHSGTDDERRQAMQKVVQTLRARHDRRWVWKTEHASLIAPSKDGLGFVADGVIEHGKLTVMYIFDTISGGTRQPNAPPMFSEPARPAYVLAPEPFDWLAGTPPPPPPPPPGVDLTPILQRLAALEANQAALRTELAALKSTPPVLPLDALLNGLQRITFECVIGRSVFHSHGCTVTPFAK